jgi:hypothetical protein
MSVCVFCTNTIYDGDNDTVSTADYKNAGTMSNHRLVQASLIRLIEKKANTQYDTEIDANFIQSNEMIRVEPLVAQRRMVDYETALNLPSDRVTVLPDPVKSNKECVIKKKISYIFQPTDYKIENVETHKIDSKVIDAVGIISSQRTTCIQTIVDELSSADLIVGFNIAYHLNVLKYEASLLGININVLNVKETKCLSCVCKTISNNNAMTREEMLNTYVSYVTTDLKDSLSNCMLALHLFFSLVESGYII